MKYSTKSGKLDDLRTDCLIVTMRAARTVARALDLDEYLVASSHDFVDKPGRSQLITLPKATLDPSSVAGRHRRRCGALTPADFRKSIGAAATALKGAPVRDAVLALDAFKVAGYDGYQKARVALALLTAQLYRFAASKQQDETPVAQIAQLAVHSDARSRTASRPLPCVMRRRSTPAWRSRATSAISRRTSATRRYLARRSQKAGAQRSREESRAREGDRRARDRRTRHGCVHVGHARQRNAREVDHRRIPRRAQQRRRRSR